MAHGRLLKRSRSQLSAWFDSEAAAFFCRRKNDAFPLLHAQIEPAALHAGAGISRALQKRSQARVKNAPETLIKSAPRLLGRRGEGKAWEGGA